MSLVTSMPVCVSAYVSLPRRSFSSTSNDRGGMGNGSGHSEVVRKYLCTEAVELGKDPSESSTLAVSRDDTERLVSDNDELHH